MHVNAVTRSETEESSRHIFRQVHQPGRIFDILLKIKHLFAFHGPIGVQFCLPALLGTAGGRRVGALQGYEGGNVRRAGEGPAADMGGGSGRLVG